MELMQKQRLPESVRLFDGIVPAPQGSRAGPHLHFTKHELAPSVVLLNIRLSGIGASVRAEIQLSHIGILWSAQLLHIFKEFQRSGHLHLHAALDILLPDRIFHVVSCRSAASVSISEGQQEGVQIPGLHAVFPHVVDLLRIRAVGIAGGQEGGHLGAVHPSPGKIVIGERISVIIGPENLLRHQVFHAAALQNLGKRGGIAEGIGQPEDHAVRSKHILVVALSMDELTDQSLSGSHIGIRLHPHGAFRNPLPLSDGLADPFKQLRIIFPAHFIGSGLALQEFIFRIFLKQPQLRGKGAGGLPVRLRHGPQPGKIQMGVSDGIEDRLGRTVYRLHHRPKLPGSLPVGSLSRFFILLKINGQREPLQRLRNLCGTQRRKIHNLQKSQKSLNVHIKLVSVLVPDSEGAHAQGTPSSLFQRILVKSFEHRSRCAPSGRRLRIIMTRIGFHQDIKPLSGFPFSGQHIIFHIMMLLADPGSAVGSKALPVHKQGGLPVRLKI